MPFVTPDDVAALQSRVRAQRDAIQFSIGTCPAAKADAVLMAQWDTFDVALNAFLDVDPSWLHTAAQMDAGEALERQLGQWPARIAAKGCSNVPPKPPEPPPSAIQQAGAIAETAVEGLVVVGLIYLAFKLVPRRGQ